MILTELVDLCLRTEGRNIRAYYQENVKGMCLCLQNVRYVFARPFAPYTRLFVDGWGGAAVVEERKWRNGEEQR